VRIRDATSDDLDLVAVLRLAFLAELRSIHSEDLPADLATRTAAFLRRHHDAGTIRTWIAEGADGCLGLVSMLLLEMAPMPDDPRELDGYLINMYVAPSARRDGVGRALLERCMVDARTIGVHRLLLFSTDDGRAMYESAGFSADDRWLDLELEPTAR
jgi:GNAT superfamily N-acetyltransferase